MPQGDIIVQQHHQQLHFQNFQYKVFHETKRHNNRPLAIPPRVHQGLKKEVLPHIPYPLDDAKMDLRNLISMDFLKKPKKPSAYDQIIKRLDSVQFHLKQLATQREKLLMVLQRPGGEEMLYSKMERFENAAPSCCRYESSEDFAMIIQKATDAIQCSTMETNLVRKRSPNPCLLTYLHPPIFDLHTVPRNDSPGQQQLRLFRLVLVDDFSRHAEGI